MAVEKAKFNNVCENFMDKVLDIYDVPGVQVGVSAVSYTHLCLWLFLQKRERNFVRDTEASRLNTCIIWAFRAPAS